MERGVVAASFGEHVRRFRAAKMLLYASGMCAEPLEISMAKSLKLLAKARSLHSCLFVKACQHQRERHVWPDASVARKWSHTLAACSLCLLWMVLYCSVQQKHEEASCGHTQVAREGISNISNMYMISRKRMPNALAPLRFRREMKQMLTTTLWEGCCGRGPIFWAHAETQVEKAPLEILNLCYRQRIFPFAAAAFIRRRSYYPQLFWAVGRPRGSAGMWSLPLTDKRARAFNSVHCVYESQKTKGHNCSGFQPITHCISSQQSFICVWLLRWSISEWNGGWRLVRESGSQASLCRS